MVRPGPKDRRDFPREGPGVAVRGWPFKPLAGTLAPMEHGQGKITDEAGKSLQVEVWIERIPEDASRFTTWRGEGKVLTGRVPSDVDRFRLALEDGREGDIKIVTVIPPGAEFYFQGTGPFEDPR